MNKIEINNALCNLVNRVDVEESAKIVIIFAHELSKSTPISLESTFQKNSNSSFTGHTSSGDLTICDHSNDRWGINMGIQKTRIGYFKVWRDEHESIWFHNFWKSEDETVGGGEKPTMYRLRYDPEKLTLLHFGFLKTIKVFSFLIFHVLKDIIEPLRDVDKREENGITLQILLLI